MSEQQNTSPAPAERPANVPEKFWDAETGTIRQDALLESYASLESKLGAGEPDAAPAPEGNLGIPRPEETATPTEGAQTSDALSEDAMASYAKEYAENGKLSEETYARLAAAGVTRGVVDTVIEDRVANGNNQVARHERSIFETVGGKENFDAIVQWAGEALTPQEIATVESQMNNMSDPAAAMAAARGLQARFLMEATRHPQNIVRAQAGTPTQDSVQTFNSMTEVAEAMSDPRYKPGTDYYAAIHKRIADSPNL